MTKRALCIGANYVGTSSQLAGCVNDANDWAAAFGERGFDVATVLDAQATRAAMLELMEQIVRETGPDDLAVITWSGHGTWTVDRSGDELDRRDEALYCADGKLILDDDLYRVFTSGHRWARVVFISDSCHSGTVNRLAGPLNATDESYSVLTQRRVKFLPPVEWMDDEDDLFDAERVQFAPSRGKPRASALLLAACSDVEVAYDAWFDGRANGAFTYAALQALAENPATYRDWQQGIRARLPSVDYDQAPQLTGGSGQRRWLTLEAEGER